MRTINLSHWRDVTATADGPRDDHNFRNRIRPGLVTDAVIAEYIRDISERHRHVDSSKVNRSRTQPMALALDCA